MHGAAGLAVLALVRWKAPVVRSGLRRAAPRPVGLRAARRAASSLALVSGVLHSTGLLVWAPGGQRTMWWHVAAGLALLPLLVWHALARRQRAAAP